MVVRLFYSNTCVSTPRPPRAVASLAKEFQGRIVVKEVNISSAQGEEEAEIFEVEMVPTVILEDGERLDGPASEEEMPEAVLNALSQSP